MQGQGEARSLLGEARKGEAWGYLARMSVAWGLSQQVRGDGDVDLAGRGGACRPDNAPSWKGAASNFNCATMGWLAEGLPGEAWQVLEWRLAKGLFGEGWHVLEGRLAEGRRDRGACQGSLARE